MAIEDDQDMEEFEPEESAGDEFPWTPESNDQALRMMCLDRALDVDLTDKALSKAAAYFRWVKSGKAGPEGVVE